MMRFPCNLALLTRRLQDVAFHYSKQNVYTLLGRRSKAHGHFEGSFSLIDYFLPKKQQQQQHRNSLQLCRFITGYLNTCVRHALNVFVFKWGLRLFFVWEK